MTKEERVTIVRLQGRIEMLRFQLKMYVQIPPNTLATLRMTAKAALEADDREAAKDEATDHDD